MKDSIYPRHCLHRNGISPNSRATYQHVEIEVRIVSIITPNPNEASASSVNRTSKWLILRLQYSTQMCRYLSQELRENCRFLGALPREFPLSVCVSRNSANSSHLISGLCAELCMELVCAVCVGQYFGVLFISPSFVPSPSPRGPRASPLQSFPPLSLSRVALSII